MRVALVAALSAVLVTATFGLVLGGTIFEGAQPGAGAHHATGRSPSQPRVETAHVLTSLPPSALAAVSGRLGAEQPRFRARRTATGYRLVAGGGIAAQLDDGGIRVRAGTDRLTLGLLAVGRDRRAIPVGNAAVSAEANRVSYRRTGLEEWYAAGPFGIEQGFTVGRRPGGDGPLALQMSLSGLRASLQGTTGVVLIDGAGHQVLAYRGLRATDARGRRLRAWLSLAGGRLAIHAADAGARYPLHIDPFIQTAKLTVAEGAASEELGFYAAMSGRTLVASGGGAEYVFLEPSGGWSGTPHEVAKLTASDGAFLGNVATSGNTIVAGAIGREVGGKKNAGAAYVFSEPAGGWSGNLHEQAKLTSSAPAENAELGVSAAVGSNGGTVVVGAPYDEVSGTKFAGAAYVFTRPPGGWSGPQTEQAKLTAAKSVVPSYFGGAVAISGPTIVVSAYVETVGSATSQGAAYVFNEPAGGWSGVLHETARLDRSDPQEDGYFGWAVAVLGRTIAVGSIESYLVEKPGAVYVFEEPAGGWSGNLHEQAKLTAAHSESFEELGYSLAISENLIVAGADLAKICANENQGAVYVFAKPPGGWASGHEVARLVAADGAETDEFGQSVGIGVNSIVGAAWFAKIGEHKAQGALYAFAIPPPPTIAIATPANGATYVHGQTLAAAYSCAPAPGGSITTCSGPVANGAPIDTSTTGSHSFSVSAADSDGFTARQTVTYTVVPAAAAKGPTLSGLRESYSVFAVANRSTPLRARTARHHHHKGTVFSFRLDQAATVKVAITRTAHGRFIFHSCHPNSPRFRHQPPCKRTVTLGTLTRIAHAGPNRIAFSGRIGRKRLPPGRYRAVFTAVGPSGKSAAHTLAFKIVRH